MPRLPEPWTPTANREETPVMSDICTGCRCTHGSRARPVEHRELGLYFSILRGFVLAERALGHPIPNDDPAPSLDAIAAGQRSPSVQVSYAPPPTSDLF